MGPIASRFGLPLLLLVLLAGNALAVEVPEGARPKIDGLVHAEEWADATLIRSSSGIARLKAAGDTLCIAIEMLGPYRGERIVLEAADEHGLDYSWHAFHPACALPEVMAFAIPPVLVRRASWSMRKKAPFSPSRSCLFRSHVLRSRKGWSAEIAVAREALDVAPDRRMVFRLHVGLPGDKRPELEFVPPLAKGVGPKGWRPLRAAWKPNAAPFETPAEDARRRLELDLYREFLYLRLGREVKRTPIRAAVGAGGKNNGRIETLLAKLDGCIEADPDDFFARFVRVRLLRRANRLKQAAAGIDATSKRFAQLDPGDPPLVAERFALLVALGRIEEALRLPLPPDARERWIEIEKTWKRSQERIAAEKGSDNPPRVAFQTGKGRIVVEFYASDLPETVCRILELVKAGSYNGRPFDKVTGAFGALVDLAEPQALPLDRKPVRLAWRGTLALLPSKEAPAKPGSALLFATGHVQLARPALAVGRIVEGMQAADALEKGDRIESAALLAGPKR